MKITILARIVALFILLTIYINASAQSLLIGVPDVTNYPTIRASLQLFDVTGNPLSGATASDFNVTENSKFRPITLLNCPPVGASVPISSVLVIDISRSMSFLGSNGYTGLSIAQAAANAWIDNIDLNISECAVTSFDDDSYLNQDFTTDRSALRNAVSGLIPRLGTSYTAALVTPPNGGIPVSVRGKNKRVVILLTDGYDFQATSNQAAAIAAAQAANVAIYCITVRLSMPATLKNIAEQTGGAWFEYVDTPDEAARIYRSILNSVQGIKPCTIEWLTDPACDLSREAIIEWLPQKVRDTVQYNVPATSLSQLTAVPSSVQLGGVPPGTSRDTIITLQTGAKPITINHLSISPSEWSIVSGNVPPLVTIPPNSFYSVTVRYTAPDSLRSYAELLIESDGCITTMPMLTAGYPRKKPHEKTLKVVHPNGGEEFLVNSDTVLKWKGVLPNEEVVLKYSIDKGKTWLNITNNATGLSLPWRVPNTPSDNCLLLATQYDQTDGLYFQIPHNDAVTDIAFSPDGQRIYTLTRRGEARQFSVQNGQMLRQYSPNQIRSFALSPNEQFLAFINTSGQMQLFNPQTGALVRNNGNIGYSGKPAFSANDSIVLALFGGNTLFAATLTSSSFGMTSIANIGSPIVSMQFTPSGTKFIGAGTAQRIARIWNFNPSPTPSVTTYSTLPHINSVLSAAISSDEQQSTTVDQNGRVALWNVQPAAERNVLGVGYKTTAISANNKYVAAGSTQLSPNGKAPATLWTLQDGQFYRNLYGHTDTINAVAFSRDGRYFATASSDSSVIIWDLSQLSSPIQADTSDNVWAIVTSGVIAQNVDMGKMQVGMSKDSVVQYFIENTGNAAVQITGISFSGLRASEFSVLSGDAPFVLLPGEKHAVEFNFTPTSVGKRSATINIQTTSDIVQYTIQGEGIIIGLQVVKNVDFGKVFLGNVKDTLVRVILKNSGTEDLAITGVASDGPDKTQFIMLDPPAGFVLFADSSRAMNLRFAPVRIGRTSGRIVFDYNEPGAPEVSLLTGEGICEDGGPAQVNAAATQFDVMPGDTISIPLLVRYPAGTLESSDRQFSTAITYNGTVLTPLADSLRPNIPRIQQTINIAGHQLSHDTLTILKFIATLGTSDTTIIEINGFTWKYCAASPLVNNGGIKIKVCPAGGKRFYMPSQTALALKINPNPIYTSNSSFEFSTPEDGSVTIHILDMTGSKVITPFDEIVQRGAYIISMNLDKLSAGVYYAVLQTSTQKIVKRMTILR